MYSALNKCLVNAKNEVLMAPFPNGHNLEEEADR